jgi:hypothetical protein
MALSLAARDFFAKLSDLFAPLSVQGYSGRKLVKIAENDETDSAGKKS